MTSLAEQSLVPLESLDAVPAIVWTADASTLLFKYVSRGAETILGYPAERWIAEPSFWQDHIFPADAHIPEICRSYSAIGEDHDLVYRMIASDGRVVWLRDQVRFRTLGDGTRELTGVMFDITSEQNTAAALAQSEANYRRMIDVSADAIGVHMNGRYVFVNPCFVELFGARDASEVIGSPVLSFVRSDFHDLVRQRLASMAEGHTPPMIREKMVRLDGRVLDAEVMALPIVWNGEDAVQVIIRDISSRIRAEDRIQLLTAGTNEAIWECNLLTDEFWSNDAYEEMFGAPSSFAEAHNRWLKRLHADDRERVTSWAERAQQNRESRWSDEYRLMLSGGSWAWFLDRGRIVNDDLERPVRLIGAMLDITNLREAEDRRREAEAIFETISQVAQRELEDSDQRYRQLVQELSDVMYTLDREGNITSVNRAFEMRTGHKADDWIGRPFSDLLSPESASQAEIDFQKLLRSADPAMHQYTMRSAESAIMEIEVSGQPRWVNGEVVGSIGIARDVTERNQLQRNLEEAHRLSSLGQLAASIAHEINNVLMAIHPFTEVLIRSASPSAVNDAAKRHINDAIARGKRITSEILLYANPKDPILESIDTNDWFGSLTATVRTIVPAFISVSCRADALRNLLADRHQLHQVVINLVTNAKDAVLEKGTISIELTHATGMLSSPELDPSRDYARLTVRDNGSGIPAALRDSIFEPLFTTKRNGTGLGLPIARRLIRRLHGDLRIESIPGEGTSVHVYIPLDSVMRSAVATPERTSDHRLERLLLVEDDDSVAEAMMAMLELEGVEVQRAACGEDAIPMLERFDAQLVVIDVNLPGISGLEVLARLRKRWPEHPVVVSTGHVIQIEVDRFTLAILKPYAIEELFQAYDRITSAS